MSVPYVHSNYNRIAGDYYPTLDERCVYGFLEHYQPSGLCVDVCAPDGSGIVDTLDRLGYEAKGIADAFTLPFLAEWIITNPPYTRRLVDDIINCQIERLERKEVYGLAVLVRSTFDHAKSRAYLFDHPFYAGQIKLLFRPWWSASRVKQPIHNYVWQIWLMTAPVKPVVLYSEGGCHNEPTSQD